jgi:rhodanese-related sulfurtransferase
LKSNIKIFLLFIIFILNLNFVFGFISPSTLTLMSAAIGSFFYHIIIIIIVYFITVYGNFKLKIKKKKKKEIFIFITLISFFLIFNLFLFNFFQLKDINNQEIENENIIHFVYQDIKNYGIKDNEFYQKIEKNNQTNISFIMEKINLFINKSIIYNKSRHEDCFKKLDSFEKKNKNYEHIIECILRIEQYNEMKKYRNERFIDLKNITNKEYSNFVIFSMTGSEYQLKNAININEPIYYLLNQTLLEKLLENYSNDKILFYCSASGSSLITAFNAYKLGYNVYYTGIRKIANLDFVNTNKNIFEYFDENKNEILIISFDEKNRNENYIFFYFENENEAEIIKNNMKNIEILNFRDNDFKDYDEINKIKKKIVNEKIVCTSNLNCLLTQQLIASFGKSDEVNKIYKIEEYIRKFYN